MNLCFKSSFAVGLLKEKKRELGFFFTMFDSVE